MAKLVTIEDIRNLSRVSGFRNVHGASAGPNGGGKTVLWKARVRRAPNHWRGPYRSTPEEAAQDYCDHINGNALTQPATLATLDKSARPKAERRTISEREREARRVLREEAAKNPPKALHEPVCYLVGIKGDDEAVKVGYADYNVYSRLDSLQTGNPRELVLLGTLPGGKVTESSLHAKYADENILQEWFRPSCSLLSEFGINNEQYNTEIGVTE